LDECRKNGVEPIEIRVGTDALAVVMDNESRFLQNLTLKQLADVYSGTFQSWNQLDPAFPRERIQLFSPGTDSGTFDYFVERVFAKDKKPMLNANPQLSEDDNVLVRGVEGSPYAIGYFGYAFFEAEKGRLKAIKIENVEPSRATVDSGTYPLARPLFLYTSRKILAEKPQVAAFAAFYLTRVNEAFKRVAYFPAPAADAAAARAAWLAAVQ
jgi:phosphate binding protein